MVYVLVGTVESDENGMPKEIGAINGGMLKRQDPVRSPVITINVKSIDQAAVAIENNGGKTVRPKMPVGNMGFAAYFKDTEGNVIGLWQNP
jgi:predicted enzyme related to lactoylglutathione lyase